MLGAEPPEQYAYNYGGYYMYAVKNNSVGELSVYRNANRAYYEQRS